jgi:hypothetical protein
MKAYHAFAVALVGWYLMVPPLPADSTKGLVDFGAPLSTWFLSQGFDTAKECEHARKKTYVEAEREERKIPLSQLRTSPRLPAIIQEMFNSCIASNDPRLKEFPVQMSPTTFQDSSAKQ